MTTSLTQIFKRAGTFYPDSLTSVVLKIRWSLLIQLVEASNWVIPEA